MKGEAEAFAVEAKGRAEAEQMTKKAEAFQQYKDGAMVDMLLEKLPLVRDNRFEGTIITYCFLLLLFTVTFFFSRRFIIGIALNWY